MAIANTDAQDTLERLARGSTPESTLRRIEAIAACGEALDRNVPPLLAVEAMTMALESGLRTAPGRLPERPPGRAPRAAPG
ncbi:hypothetical protein STENM223S_08955 [Streptomyces tendae]